ncbi:hypothetical protein P7H22_10770 [Paenibacillus larvae]|nr:hypothetical protein [Paenibacillus larvae]MDT2240725.1 hypothetical protein [Paenibacillus larvae]
MAIANGILKAFGTGPVGHQDAGRPVDAGIAENVINSFLVKGRYDAHAAGNADPAIGFVFAKMSYGYLRACTARTGQTA